MVRARRACHAAGERAMEGEDLKRKLATILVADIVGYSRLTANDEDWTIRALGEFRGVGDGIIRGNDLLGDGVNVAARLEGIAEPGGICVSGTVWDHINGKLSIGYVDIGEQAVKNIPRPVRAYHLRPDGGEAGILVADDPGFRPGQPRGRSNRGALFGALGGALAVAIAAVLVWAFWLRPPALDPQRPSETTSAQN